MRNPKLWGILAVAAVVALFVARAEMQRASPHETATGTVDGATISIDYGRPYVKGREIWGGLNPWDKVWRLGADEATTLTSSAALQFGSLAVPAGKHTLYMWVSETEPKLIVNKQTGQWGTVYDEAQDLGRVALEKATLPAPVEQLTLAIESRQGGGGVLKISWETHQYSAPFTVRK